MKSNDLNHQEPRQEQRFAFRETFGPVGIATRINNEHTNIEPDLKGTNHCGRVVYMNFKRHLLSILYIDKKSRLLPSPDISPDKLVLHRSTFTHSLGMLSTVFGIQNERSC